MACRTAFAFVTLALTSSLLLPEPTWALACGDRIDAGQTVTLTADLDCTGISSGHGVVMHGGTLDCGGHSILGPDQANWAAKDDAQTGHYGIQVLGPNAIVRNCTVMWWERGIVVDGNGDNAAHHGVFQANSFCQNARYGGALTGFNAHSNVFDTNVFCENGDEGFHISGPFDTSGPDASNRIVAAQLHSNWREGFYFLNANSVNVYGSATRDNGQSGQSKVGLYVKASSGNVIQQVTLTNDDVHIVDASTANLLSTMAVFGGRVKLAKLNGQVPSGNTIQYLCVHFDAGAGRPDSAFYFEGVTNGLNNIWHGAAFDTPTSATALEESTGNAVVGLFSAPGAMPPDVRAGSSFSAFTTTDTATCDPALVSAGPGGAQ